MRGFVGKDTLGSTVHLLSIGRGNVNASVIHATAPFSHGGAFLVRVPTLNDGDDALVGAATQLLGDAIVCSVDNRQHLASCLFGNSDRIESQEHANAK